MNETTANHAETDKRAFTGRAPILVNAEKVDRDNVVKLLNDALPTFWVNKAQISYLWDYFKGDQPILSRSKDVRPEINNMVVENHAQEIVTFKVGYQFNEYLQYNCRMDETDERYQDKLRHVNELNTLMFAEDKPSCDHDLFEWMCVCGLGYRMCEPDVFTDSAEGGAPFEVITLDPRNTFTVQSAAYHHRTLMSVWVGLDENDREVFNVLTDEAKFLVRSNEVVSEEPLPYRRNPIVEYRLNNARMGVFEPVIPLLDAMNTLESNRLDDIEQVVQALMVFMNCDIDEDGFDRMREKGAIKVRSVEPGIQAAIEMLTNSLDHAGTQTVKEDIYQAVTNICGMPNRNGTSGSSSDTGAAVILRDGWTLAESHAKSYELQMKKSEREFLKVVLAICAMSKDVDLGDLSVRDIELAFNRRNYENIMVKSQVLTTMLSTPMIHPQLAFQACGLFSDPDAAYTASMEYREKASEPLQGLAPAGEVDHGRVGSQAGVPEPGDDAAVAASA